MAIAGAITPRLLLLSFTDSTSFTISILEGLPTLWGTGLKQGSLAVLLFSTVEKVNGR